MARVLGSGLLICQIMRPIIKSLQDWISAVTTLTQAAAQMVQPFGPGKPVSSVQLLLQLVSVLLKFLAPIVRRRLAGIDRGVPGF